MMLSRFSEARRFLLTPRREVKLTSTSSLFVRVIIFALGFALLETGVRFLGGAQLGLADAAWSFVGGMFIALLFAWALPKTRLKTLDLIVLVWLALFVVQEFSNMLEGYFFTTYYPSVSVLVGAVFSSLLTTLVQGVMAGALFLPETHDRGLVSELSSYLKQRSPASWAWRIPVASLAYFPIYFFFGALISPFVVPYYTNPSFGLRIPPFTLMIPLEFLRGFLYVMSLLTIFAAIKTSRRTLSAVIAFILYVPGALVPLMLNRSLPPEIVPFHLVEILADSAFYGAVTTYLLGRKSS
jgi:hypothetical protein